ncbi:MAG: hypothetical protein ABIT37_15845 [Luteolibacter sp.]
MKFPILAASLLFLPTLLMAEEEAGADKQAQHKEGSAKVADKQDELSADVQQLAIEQTVPEVIQLLNDVEKIMDEATDRLAGQDTGGDTIAAQTEIIEKIHAAAKEKKKQSGGGDSGNAMMDMMERMMGKKPEGEQPGKGKDGKPSDKGGNGVSGLSDTGNDPTGGEAGGKSEARRVPKAAGTAGHALPEEFRKALDAYNRGAEQKVK